MMAVSDVDIAQMKNTVGDVIGNTDKILGVVREHRLSSVLLFPELSVSGYLPEDMLYLDGFISSCEDSIRRISKEVGSTVVVVGGPRRDGSKVFNSAFILQNGNVIGVYDKKYLPNYSVFDERRYFSPRTKRASPINVELNNGVSVVIGIGICEDIWRSEFELEYPERSIDILLTLNASPFVSNKIKTRETMVAQWATHFNCDVAYSNFVGGQDEVVFDGGSMWSNSIGDVVAAPIFKEGVFKKEDASRVAVNYVDDLNLALTVGIRDYFAASGATGAIIGLSGGIDSAVTAVLAVEALGKENVVGVLMPSKYSSDHSVSDANELASSLGIKTYNVPIKDGFDATMASMDKFNDIEAVDGDVSSENIQARIRGMILMGLSNKSGMMVLATGNKSEFSVGYCTLYGDMAGGFAAIKDVYKLDVFALAKHMNRDGVIIPMSTITKPPSAELGEGQLDTDSLPDYGILDPILKMIIEDGMSASAVVSRGYDSRVVSRVHRLIQVSEFKRRQAPLGVKVTRLAFGKDRRYPISQRFNF